MTFAVSVAGPSRLPCKAVQKVLARGYAARVVRQPDLREERDSEGRGKHSRSKMGAVSGSLFTEPDDIYGLQHWLLDYGAEFKDVVPGERANWLGGTVPYPGNPSFRPPPPLSNDIQNKLYTTLTKTGKTAGQIAEQFNISKARIEAVRKLKEVEAEFMRQSKPLQHAFLAGMEPLLNVQSLTNRHTKKYDATLERDEALLRGSHPSTLAERLEEDRHDAGVGQGGAFGEPASDRARQGLSKAAWEFRSEEAVLAGTGHEGQSGSREVPSLATPLTDAAEEKTARAKLERPSFPSTESKTSKSTFRFIDVSSKKPSWELRKAEEAKEARKAHRGKTKTGGK